MSSDFADNFAKLSPDAQRLARIDQLRAAAQQAGASRPGDTANFIAARHSSFLPTKEAAKKLVSEYAFIHAEEFSSGAQRSELASAIDSRNCEQLSRDAGVREDSIRDVVAHIASAPNRLVALTELRSKRPDLFSDEVKRLSAEQLKSLSPAEYRKIRRENPQALGLRR